MRYLTFESDFNGTSQEFIASLHTLRRNLRVSKLTYSKLLAEESAQAYLLMLIEAACQGYFIRIEKQALMIPALGSQLIWYESSFAVLTRSAVNAPFEVKVSSHSLMIKAALLGYNCATRLMMAYRHLNLEMKPPISVVGE